MEKKFSGSESDIKIKTDLYHKLNKLMDDQYKKTIQSLRDESNRVPLEPNRYADSQAALKREIIRRVATEHGTAKTNLYYEVDQPMFDLEKNPTWSGMAIMMYRIISQPSLFRYHRQ